MLEQSIIRPGAPRRPSTDFLLLRESAMEVVQRLAGSTWTDHNLHDPGITILEQVVYALTDLGFRAGFSVPELLADAIAADAEGQLRLSWVAGADDAAPQGLPGMPPATIALPSAPVGIEDWRRILLDIPGMRSVGILPAENSSPRLHYDKDRNELLSRANPDPALLPITLTGLYQFEVDAEEGSSRDGRRTVLTRFHKARPVGEDLHHLNLLQPGQVILHADLDLVAGSDVDDVLAQIFFELDQYLSPQPSFKCGTTLLNAGKSEEAYDGPLLDGGVLLRKDIAGCSPRKVIYLSRVIEAVRKVKGISGVRSIHLDGPSNHIDAGGDVQFWVPAMSEGMVPRLDIDPRTVVLRTLGGVVVPDRARVQALFREKRERRLGRARTDATLPADLPRQRQVDAYQSIQHHFPDNYGINGYGLPAQSGMSRQVQAHQLKTWLLFFEKVMADRFAMLGGMGAMFQLRDGEATAFAPGQLADVPKVAESFLDLPEVIAQDPRDERAAILRVQRLLAHLAARFGHDMEQMLPFAHQEDAPLAARRAALGAQVRLWRALPDLARQRGRGTCLLPDTQAGPGLKERIALLLGLRPDDPAPGLEQTDHDVLQQVDFFMVEQVLLRPLDLEYTFDQMLFRFRNGRISKIVRQQSSKDRDKYRFRCYATGTKAVVKGDEIEVTFVDTFLKRRFTLLEVYPDGFLFDVDIALATAHGNPQGGSWNKTSDFGANLYADPWSMQVTFVFPNHHPRIPDEAAQQHVEQVLRQETPAHLAVHVEWMEHAEMLAFSRAYRHWRIEHARYLTELADGGVPDKVYARLRHYRNAVLRSIVSGETDLVRDMPIEAKSEPGVVIETDRSGNLHIHVPSTREPIRFFLAETEPEVEYHLGKQVEPDDWDDLQHITTEQEVVGEGLMMELPASRYPQSGTWWYAIVATHSLQGLVQPLHRRIKLSIGPEVS